MVLDEDDFITFLVREATAGADSVDESVDGLSRAREMCAAAVTQLEAYSAVATVEDIQ